MHVSTQGGGGRETQRVRERLTSEANCLTRKVHLVSTRARLLGTVK